MRRVFVESGRRGGKVARNKRLQLISGLACAFCTRPVVKGFAVARYRFCAHHMDLLYKIALAAGMDMPELRAPVAE